jgi:hypothetical protein
VLKNIELSLSCAARDFFQAFKADHQSAHGRDLQKLEGVSNPQHLLVKSENLENLDCKTISVKPWL